MASGYVIPIEIEELIPVGEVVRFGIAKDRSSMTWGASPHVPPTLTINFVDIARFELVDTEDGTKAIQISLKTDCALLWTSCNPDISSLHKMHELLDRLLCEPVDTGDGTKAMRISLETDSALLWTFSNPESADVMHELLDQLLCNSRFVVANSAPSQGHKYQRTEQKLDEGKDQTSALLKLPGELRNATTSRIRSTTSAS